jgi:rod shape-determining protein MreC
MRRLTRRQRIAAMILAAVALLFITLDLGGGGLRPAHSGVRGVLGALYRGTDGVLGPTRRFVEGIPSAGSNQARVEKLRAENAALRGQLAAAEANQRTAAQLARLQLAVDRSGLAMVPARVIALGPGQGFDWTVTLDAGRRAGIRPGETVSDGAGLVGRVLHADDSTSVVLLCADPGSGVGVRDERTGELGVASGSGPGGFSFVPLNPTTRIQVGDELLTGPAGATSYVSGLAVGTVTAVRTSADGTTRASVRPAVSPTGLDLVGVIVDASAGDGSRVALQPSATEPSATPSSTTGAQH